MDSVLKLLSLPGNEIIIGPPKIRLKGGPDNSSGRVEIQRDDVWGTICDDLWDINDANVVCRSGGMALGGVRGRGTGWALPVSRAFQVGCAVVETTDRPE